MGRLLPSLAASRGAVPFAIVLVSILVLGPGDSGAATGVGPLRTVASNPVAVRVAVTDLTPAWQALPGEGAARYDLQMEGFDAAGEAGGVRVPVAAGWILVPPGTRPVLTVVGETWQDAGGRPLALVPVTATRPGPDGGTLVDVIVPPGGALPEGLELTDAMRASMDRAARPRGGAAAELGEPGWWRGRRVAALRVVPVRWDDRGNAVSVLTGGTWEVRFVPEKAAPGLSEVGRLRRTTANDEMFGSAFLNGDQLKSLPTEAAWRGIRPVRDATKAAGDKRATLVAPEVKLAVRATRLYKVSAARLREEGLLPDTPIQESEIRLYQRRYLPDLDDGSTNPPYAEVEVPIHMVGDGGLFEGSDYFVFYGLRLRDDTAFTADLGAGPVDLPDCGDLGEWANQYNWYWLAAAQPEAGSAWARMETTTVAPSAGTPLANFRRTDHYEDQLAMREKTMRTDIDRTYLNLYQDHAASIGVSDQWAPDLAGGTAHIAAAAATYSYVAGVSRPVRFDLTTGTSANPTTWLLGNVGLVYSTDRTFSWDVDAAELAGTGARFSMTSTAPGLGQLFAYLNWVEVTYDALYKAVGNEQKFNTGNATGSRPVEVTGFQDADLSLVDITNVRRPVWVALDADNVVDAGDGTYTLSILPYQVSANVPLTYWSAGASGGYGIAEPAFNASLVKADPVNPTEATGAAPDLIVVTHGDFKAGIQRWIDHRKTRAGGNLDVLTVDVADLYDWYSGGIKSRWAIKRFVNHALAEWGTWALVIVGDANENQRQLKVLPEALAWSEDFVPTHYHVQNAVNGVYEFMATDKWYVSDEGGTNDATDDFPNTIRTPWTMLTGRLPVNSTDELTRVIDKIVQVESLADGQDWHRRGIFFADDAFSNGLGVTSLDTLTFSAGELQFAWSEQDSLAPWWEGGTPVTLDKNLLLEDSFLAPYFPGTGFRLRDDVRNVAETTAVPALLSALSSGSLVAHFQGHANATVLTSESWFQDARGTTVRRDVPLLANNGKPWVFFGMACHVSDWAQSPTYFPTVPYEPALGEKVLVWTDAGASATYGSSGYEYIDKNRAFSERIFRVWTHRPPVVPAHGGSTRSRWIIGELLWQAEAEHLAANLYSEVDRDMVSQYVLLGDPLMNLDAGPPQVTAVLEGSPDQEVSGTVELTSDGPANLRTVRIDARDEAGIDRLQVIDSDGVDLTDQVVVMADSLPPGQSDQQQVFYRLAVPVLPYPHSVDVNVWDTGGPLPTDRHWTLTLDVAQEVAFSALGQPVDPNTFAFTADVPVDFQGTVTSAAWLDAGTTWSLTSENLQLSNVVLPSGKDNSATFSFTATAVGDAAGQRSVVLSIDGHPSTWDLQAAEPHGTDESIDQVYSFPNPMADRTRFLFSSGAVSGRGVIRVFATNGRVVARIPFDFAGGGSGVVEWDGRDDEGDQLANGTYLYRVEMTAPSGQVNSPVQRLVVMR